MEIQSKELRIGNLVQITDDGLKELWNCTEDVIDKVQEVEVFSTDELILNEYEFGYSEIKPIPLTEDYLVKFGGIKTGITFRFGKYILWWTGEDEHKYSFMLYDERDTNDNQIGKVYSKELTKVKTVHHFQNIMMDLGEELTIKDK